MDKKTDMAAAAAQLFAREGLRGIGVDHIGASVGASTRTLYKHFGSRDGLVMAALQSRHAAFMAVLQHDDAEIGTVESLFDTLEKWSAEFGASGCLLLRAGSEYRGANDDIVALVRRQKDVFFQEVARRVSHALGHDDPLLSSQIWILFEGATAIASLDNTAVIRAARAAVTSLLAHADKRSEA
jgi:AcrR family transcriptional regulator